MDPALLDENECGRTRLDDSLDGFSNICKNLKREAERIISDQSKTSKTEAIEEVEKRRTDNKIKSILKKLEQNARGPSSNGPLTYAQANLFLEFLETFAMQDTYQPQLTKKEIKTIPKLKKRLMYEKSFERGRLIINQEDITKLRLTLFHDRPLAKYITPTNIEDLMQPEVRVFFDQLYTFALGFNADAVDFSQQNDQAILKSGGFDENLHLVPYSSPEEREVADRHFITIFCENATIIINNRLSSTTVQAALCQLKFDVVVNMPTYIKRVVKQKKTYTQATENLTLLRNSLTHCFNKHIQKTSLIGIIYSIYLDNLAKNVQQAMVKTDPPLTEDKLKSVLHDTNGNFANIEFNLNSLERNTIFGTVSSNVKNKNHFKINIETYLIFMAPLFDINYNTGRKAIAMKTRDLYKIYQSFFKLHTLMGESADINDQKKKLERELCSFGFDKDLANEVLNYGASMGDDRPHAEIKNINDDVQEIIKSILNVSTTTELRFCNISMHDLTMFYSTYVKGTGAFTFCKHPNLLQHLSLKDYHIKKIEGLINNIPVRITRTYTFKGRPCQIELSNVVEKILSLYDDDYKPCDLKIKTIQDMVINQKFLEHLEAQEHLPKLDTKLTKDLLEFDCGAPLIVCLMRSRNEMHVFEAGVFKKLAGKLTRSEYLPLFKSLMDKSDLTSFPAHNDLVETFYECIEPENACEMLKILADLPNDRRSIFLEALSASKCVYKGNLEILLNLVYEEVLKYLNPTVLHKAYRLLEIIGGLQVKGNFCETTVSFQTALYQGKYYLLYGESKNAKNGLESFKKCIATLEPVINKNATEKKQLMMALSMTAYSHCCMGHSERDPKKFSEAVETQKKLWAELRAFTNVNGPNSETVDTKTIFTEILGHDDYKALLKASTEHSRFLNVFTVCSNLLFYKLSFLQCKNGDVSKFELLLRDLKDIYNVYVKSQSPPMATSVMQRNADYERERERLRSRIFVIHVELGRLESDERTKKYHFFKALELILAIHKQRKNWLGAHSPALNKTVDMMKTILCDCFKTRKHCDECYKRHGTKYKFYFSVSPIQDMREETEKSSASTLVKLRRTNTPF